jgi:hypothetical protein
VRRAVAIGILGTGAVLALPAVAGAAGVQPYGGGSHFETDSSTAQVSDPPAASNTDDPGTLPFTGGDVAGLAVIGAGAVGVGFIALRARRNAARA